MTVTQVFKIGLKTAAFLIWQPSFGFYTMQCAVVPIFHLEHSNKLNTVQGTKM